MSVTAAATWNRSQDDTHAVRARLERLEWVAHSLDTAVVIPGTRIRFGLDAIIGLLPGGDAVSTAAAAWIVYEAHRLGVPRRLLAKMAANVVVDGLVGAVPIAGDAFDVFWRVNRRNVRLLREHLEGTRRL